MTKETAGKHQFAEADKMAGGEMGQDRFEIARRLREGAPCTWEGLYRAVMGAKPPAGTTLEQDAGLLCGRLADLIEGPPKAESVRHDAMEALRFVEANGGLEAAARALAGAAPDSWWRVEEDALKGTCGYFGHGEAVGCYGCPAESMLLSGHCSALMARDLVRRCRELAWRDAR